MGAPKAETIALDGRLSHGLEEAAGGAIVLPEVLDMRACRALKKTLQTAFDSGAACSIDAGNVRRVSTGCLQVLTAFIIGMGQRAASVRFARTSAEFMRGVELLGLHGAFASCNLE